MNAFQGKVAVVTGGAEGIGKAIATRAAVERMKLVLADIDRQQLDATVSDLIAQGAEAVGMVVDVSQADQVNALADLAFERFGNVHLLVNNAGVACAQPVWELTPADWDWVMGVNLYGVTHSLRSFIPRMLANGEEGHIVNTASIAGLLSQPGLAAYNASKHAVVTISEGLHHGLTIRQAKLNVSVLCPAWVKTRIAESERNRTPGDWTNISQLDPIAAKIGAAVMNAVKHGMAASEVAEAVFAAIVDKRFYILTHPHTKQLVQTRLEDILQDRQPVYVSIK